MYDESSGVFVGDDDPISWALRQHVRKFNFRTNIKTLAATITFIALPSHAATLDVRELADLSFEELGNIKVTSVSKKPERLADAAASVFVITAEDIRRSGANSLPEVLRLAPNLQVAQTSVSGYAISARGLNGSNNSAPNKLLVLIDGRSVYSPLFSGVFWDVQDVMLEDVERIEVISGPGATLWGVNAVNGVINVITRSAQDTHGGLLAVGGGRRGNDEAFRYGGTIAGDGDFRVYGKYDNRRHTRTEDQTAVNDASHRAQIGFRTDWARPSDNFTLLGNAYSGTEEQPAPGAISISGTAIALGSIEVSGANMTADWKHQLQGGSNISLQAYYDRTTRSVPPTFDDTLDVVDVQLQHSFSAGTVHAITWGLNYRYGMDHVTNSRYFAFLPADVDQRWTSLFAQDEIKLHQNLQLTAGARLEHNDYTGYEFLPSLRLAWKASPNHLIWTAFTRTVRAPSRLDHDAYTPGTSPCLLCGGPDVQSEVVKAYELGYRGQLAAKLSYSATIFHNHYEHLRTLEIAPSGTFLTFGNDMKGNATGIEMWGTYQALRQWRLSAGFTALRERFQLAPGSPDTTAPSAAGNDPKHTAQLRSSWNITANHDLDVTVRHVAKLQKNEVPAYTTADVRFGWKLRQDLDLSIVGQNLFDHHSEYGTQTNRTEIAPAFYVKLLWRL
ncbi:MAG: TonB-dependent receptor [Rhodocyclales bacterium]|nr:TonB-dependent receptor [Rhodocyclales bacterium]